MDNLKVSVQRGLNDITDLLIQNGYDVCQMGACSSDVDITIINVSDFEYEGISGTACRINGEDKRTLLINSAIYSPHEILDIIKNKTCNCIS